MAVLLACGCSSDEPDSDSIDGAYFGDVLVDHNDTARSIFTAAALVVGGNGNVQGSMLTTVDPTSVVGETGTVTGQLRATSSFEVDADLVVEFPTLGRFTAKGSMIYSEVVEGLAGMLTTRDALGAVVGRTVISVQRE
jgi:hypothetical protein